ncbi:MAG: glycosyltransferase family 39 protein, partial [Thermoproteota archaeon]|nr:glycosyltransferase family 39 protein [Thermoproteota archaeon]
MSTLKRTKHNSLDIRLNGDIISVTFVTLPLLLSAFTHIWNPVGSPSIHDDEGHYIRRAIHVSEGLGAQERDRGYDHPYFGWLFLGSIFSTSGYPDSLNPKPGDVSSVEALWSIPRVIVGALAIVDTFLIYKIAQIRYNRAVAFIAAILFAVMPSSWFIRSVFLETLQLPLILLSILFAVCYEKSFRDKLRFGDVNQCNKLPFLLLPILSGIFLGLAIFTKIPAITFISVVAYLIVAAGWRNRSRKRVTIMRLRNLAFWFIPVILVPMLWPLYAISVDGYDSFIEGINFQMTRSSRPLLDAMLLLFSTDPVLLTAGMVGIAYCAAKREFVFLIWIVPSLLFLYILDYVSYFFLFPLIPAFCIAS